jgi:hypothetical protein
VLRTSMARWPAHRSIVATGGGPGHDVEDSGQSGLTCMVAEEARALWMPVPSCVSFAKVEERRRCRAPAWPRGRGGPGCQVPAWAKQRRNGVQAPTGRWVIGSNSRSELGARVCERVSGGTGPDTSARLGTKSPYFHRPTP